MTQAGDEQGGPRPGRWRATAIAASILAHLVALALLAWTTPALRLPVADWAADVTVQLTPRRPRPPAEAATAGAELEPHAAVAAPTNTPALPFERPQRSTTARAALPYLPPSPAARPSSGTIAGAASAGSSRSAPGAAASDSDGGDVRGAVRAAIGCNHEDYLRLTDAERAACERKYADMPKTVGPRVDPIPPLKRGDFDRRAAYDERCHRYATPVGKPTGDSINRRPSFDEAPPAVRPSGPPPPSPWLFC